jgi:hypothetical protein
MFLIHFLKVDYNNRIVAGLLRHTHARLFSCYCLFKIIDSDNMERTKDMICLIDLQNYWFFLFLCFLFMAAFLTS